MNDFRWRKKGPPALFCRPTTEKGSPIVPRINFITTLTHSSTFPAAVGLISAPREVAPQNATHNLQWRDLVIPEPQNREPGKIHHLSLNLRGKGVCVTKSRQNSIPVWVVGNKTHSQKKKTRPPPTMSRKSSACRTPYFTTFVPLNHFCCGMQPMICATLLSPKFGGNSQTGHHTNTPIHAEEMEQASLLLVLPKRAWRMSPALSGARNYTTAQTCQSQIYKCCSVPLTLSWAAENDSIFALTTHKKILPPI